MNSVVDRLAEKVDVASWSDVAHERNMRLAVNVARRASLAGHSRTGVVLVDSMSRVVATGTPLMGLLRDPTAHAEMVAIRGASVKVRRSSLCDLVLYTTVQPCVMCFEACAWAQLGGVVYAVDASAIECDRSECYASDSIEKMSDARLFVRGGVLEDETKRLLCGDVCCVGSSSFVGSDADEFAAGVV